MDTRNDTNSSFIGFQNDDSHPEHSVQHQNVQSISNGRQNTFPHLAEHFSQIDDDNRGDFNGNSSSSMQHNLIREDFTENQIQQLPFYQNEHQNFNVNVPKVKRKRVKKGSFKKKYKVDHRKKVSNKPVSYQCVPANHPTHQPPPNSEIQYSRIAQYNSIDQFHNFCLGCTTRDYAFEDIFETYVRIEDNVTCYSCKLCEMKNFSAPALRSHVQEIKKHVLQVKMLNESINGETPDERRKCAQGMTRINFYYLLIKIFNFRSNFK